MSSAGDNRVTSASLMAALADIERRFPVVDWKIGGMRIWPLVRVRWFFAIWGAAYGSSATPQPRWLSVARHLGGIAAGRLRQWAARAVDQAGEASVQPRDVVFLSDGVSFVERSGRYYERFCDPIIEMLQARGISTLLLTPGHRYLRPRSTPSAFVQSRLDLAELAGLRNGRALAESASLPALDEVRAALDARGWDHPSLSRARLAADAGRIESMAQAFGESLDRVRPRMAFIVSYYSMAGAAFALACRRRAIPLVDIQHGVEGPLHPAYGLPQAPQGGYELVPDRFWVWSADEAEAISSWAREGTHRALIGGNRWLDLWLDSDAPEMHAVDAEVRALRARSGGARVVLVSLQWGLSPAEQLRPLLDLMGSASSDWAWWVRLHPLMIAQRTQIAAELASVRGVHLSVDEASELPLYGLLRHVDVHLTHSSSVVLEALNFGVCSVVTSRYGAEVFPKALDSGDVSLAEGDSAQTLAALATQAARRRPLRSSSRAAEAALQSLLGETEPVGAHAA